MLLGEIFRMVYIKCVSCNGKLHFSRKTQKKRLIGYSIAHKIHFLLGKIKLVALDTHAKKMNPRSFWVGGGGGAR